MGETRAELLGLFDNWLAPSVGLRQYLWAHRRESIETARKLIELIPPVVLKSVLGYLVLNYWGHYSGWPDLLVYRANRWFLAEVKSWSDKLNDNQKRWIEDNHVLERGPNVPGDRGVTEIWAETDPQAVKPPRLGGERSFPPLTSLKFARGSHPSASPRAHCDRANTK